MVAESVLPGHVGTHATRQRPRREQLDTRPEDADRRVRSKVVDLGLEPLRASDIVRVHPGHQGGAGEAEALVEGGREPARVARSNPEARIQSGASFEELA